MYFSFQIRVERSNIPQQSQNLFPSRGMLLFHKAGEKEKKDRDRETKRGVTFFVFHFSIPHVTFLTLHSSLVLDTSSFDFNALIVS